MRVIYLILFHFIWSSDQQHTELQTQLAATTGVLPLGWQSRFAGCVTRRERKLQGHCWEVKASWLEGWESSWETGKGRGITLARVCKTADFGNCGLFTEQGFEWGSAQSECALRQLEEISKREMGIRPSAAPGPADASVPLQQHLSRVGERLVLSQRGTFHFSSR